MQLILIVFHIVIALALIVLVLLQQGKGAAMGAAFGSGASNTLFGSRGPASFLIKLTSFLAAMFFLTSLTLGYFVAREAHLADQIQVAQVPDSNSHDIPNLTIPK